MYFNPSMAIALIFLLLPGYLTAGSASLPLTEKQLEAHGKRVGKTYWVVAEENQKPVFFSSPSPSAPSFLAGAKESFEITEIVGASTQRLYYKVRFAPGKEGYISVDSFLEELNSTIATLDPDRDQKRKSAKEANEENKREAWIRAQPWPEHVKEAVLKRKAVLGMTMSEAKVALGKPTRVVKLKAASTLMGEQQQWIYDGGPVLTFTNGMITRIQTIDARAE
ncbi:MAG: hypothetical protein ACREQA_15000 [Candidatus Binatia bacterium]